MSSDRWLAVAVRGEPTLLDRQVSARIRRCLLGTLLAIGFFFVAATVLRVYIADILVAALPYGALATPIAVLLFCFFFGMAILLGAELNATIQDRWPAPLRRHEKRRQQRRAEKLERARRLDTM